MSIHEFGCLATSAEKKRRISSVIYHVPHDPRYTRTKSYGEMDKDLRRVCDTTAAGLNNCISTHVGITEIGATVHCHDLISFDAFAVRATT